MRKIKDFFYDKNDIIVVLIILLAAAFIIYTRIEVIMEYPQQTSELITNVESVSTAIKAACMSICGA